MVKHSMRTSPQNLTFYQCNVKTQNTWSAIWEGAETGGAWIARLIWPQSARASMQNSLFLFWKTLKIKQKNRRKIGMTCTRARCRKIFKHFLGQGPEAPRFTRAGRARARARALSTRRFSRVSALFLIFLISLAHSPLPKPPSLCARPYGKT